MALPTSTDRRLGTLVLTLGLTLAITACGGGGSKAASTSSGGATKPTSSSSGSDGPINADPCKLLTDAQVIQILGSAGTPTEHPDGGFGRFCVWSDGASNATTVHVVLVPANLCKLERALPQRSEGDNVYHPEIAQGAMLHAGTLDVETAKGCFSTLGDAPNVDHLADDKVLEAAHDVLGNL